MFIVIEIIAGQILTVLEQKGSLNLYELKSLINEPEVLIVEGLKWLIRMEYITENALTKEYVINRLKHAAKEEEAILELASRD